MNSTANRADLLKITGLVRPALATADFIPALQHILFDGEFATAYNDVAAIVVRADIGIKRCIPGDLLIRALGSFNKDSVALTYDEKTSALLVSSGKSKVKLPTMAPSEFPFEVPSEIGTEIQLTESMVKAIERCLISVGTDNKHPSAMGVTIEVEDGKAVFYSTDNLTISRAATDETIELPGDTPVILPTFMCTQLVSMFKVYREETAWLILLGGGMLVDFVGKNKASNASLFHRSILDLEPIDFPKIIRRHVDPAAALKTMQPIPEGLDDAFGRAMLVLASEEHKATSLESKGGELLINSESDKGVSDDDVKYTGPDAAAFKVDPAHVVRALKTCTTMALNKKVMLMGADNFIHLISHLA